MTTIHTKNRQITFILGVFFLFLSNFSCSQSFTLKLLPLDQPPSFLKEKIEYNTSFADSITLIGELKNILLQLHGQSFLEASVDTLAFQDSIGLAILHIGKAYQWATLSQGNVEDVFLEQIGFRQKLYQNNIFSHTEIQQLLESLLTYAENNGYPFAEASLKNIILNGEKVSADIHLEKNKLIHIKDIELTGSAAISKIYLTNYLGITKGSLYSKEKLLRIKDRIKELPFLKLAADPSVKFVGKEATLTLKLDKKKASRFDFIIGVLPKSATTEKLLITGNFNGEFQNQFGLGERIYAEFNQLRPLTQELDIQFNYPYVLDLPFGIDTKFSLFKRDTSYIDIEADVGVQYLLEGGDYLKAYWNNRTTNLLTVDTVNIKATQQLPEILDLSNAMFGLEYNRQKLDYRFNPRKGWQLFLRVGAGIKTIKRNRDIENTELRNLYDSIDLRSFQYKIDAQIAKFFPLGQQSTLKASVQSGVIIAPNPIYTNEQYRIGGNRILRGFDEESIFTTNYTIATLEYRLLLSQNSYLYLFGDYARTDNENVNTIDEDTVSYPYGFGTGITFETKVGLFGISLAVGGQQGTPIDFSAPKVHFGYVSLF